jgi:pimeloyl-ACP methyl ester carboxylesterase
MEPSERTRALRDSLRAAASIAHASDDARADVHLPPIQRATTADGAAIAYWAYGEGDGVPLVSMPSLPHSDLRCEWSVPEWRGHLLRLARDRMLVRYDPRAVGQSRPGVSDFSVDAAVAELDAVTHAAGVDRFAIWAPFHSGAAAITYAARNPERVTALVLWCCYARGSDLRQREELTSLRRLLTADWHVYSESAAQFLFAWDHQQLARQYAALIRESSDPETSRAFSRAAMEYDVTALLPAVRVPVLVMHRRDMPWLTLEYAEQLAREIPQCELHILDGAAAVPFVEDACVIADMVDEFLDRTLVAGWHPPTPSSPRPPH